MTAQPRLRKFKVSLRRRGGNTKGHITVDATMPSHAERVAIRQLIEVSYPNSKPSNWIVTSTQELPNEKTDCAGN